MKKKNKKKTRKRSRKIRKSKTVRIRQKYKKKKIIKKTSKTKKKYRKSREIKKIKPKKRSKRIQNLKINKQINQFEKLSFQRIVNFIFQPFIKAYDNFREKRKKERLKQINLERKQQEKQIKEEERLRHEFKQKELKQEIKLAKERSHDLKRFIREEQAILREEHAKKRRRFLESIKLESRIEAYRRRELLEIYNLEKLALKEQREDYRPLQERLEKIKDKYRLIREQKIRERVKSLGLEVSDTDTKEDLLQKQKEHEEQRRKVELVLESFYRSANSLVFQLNKRYIPKHKSILRVIDRRYEENLCFIRYDDNSDDDWLILIYLEDSNPAKETIIVEDKTNPEKYVTKSFQTKEIFTYSDYLVDQMTSHIDRERKIAT